MLKKTVCVFTGHRQIKDEFLAEKLEYAIERFLQEGVTTFYCGMALGFDLLAAEKVIHLKTKYPSARLIACIPCSNQRDNYSPVDKKRYLEILKKCDEEICLSDSYFKGCMHARNRYMVDRADCMIAYLKKQEGGTAFTVALFAKKHPGKEIFFIE